MINSFIEHLVVMTDLLEFLVVFLDVSWFQESCLMSLVHFFLGPLRARQFKVAVFVFEQEVFDLGICWEETGLFHSCNFEGLARLGASYVRRS